MTTTGLSQWTLTTPTKTYQLSGKSSLNQLRLTMKDSLPFGKPESILSTESNSIQRRTASNGKFLLTDHTTLSKLSKLCRTNSSRKPGNQRTPSLLMMSTKNTAFTTSKPPPLPSHSPEFTDLMKLHHQLLSKLRKPT